MCRCLCVGRRSHLRCGSPRSHVCHASARSHCTRTWPCCGCYCPPLPWVAGGPGGRAGGGGVFGKKFARMRTESSEKAIGNLQTKNSRPLPKWNGLAQICKMLQKLLKRSNSSVYRDLRTVSGVATGARNGKIRAGLQQHGRDRPGQILKILEHSSPRSRTE